jgi:glutaredoxin 3
VFRKSYGVASGGVRIEFVSTTILYVKAGCPYCAAAMDYLDEHQIAYEQIDVRGDDEGMKKLKELSGQTKTPTLVLEDKVLANFGVKDLEKFLAEQGVEQA